MLNGASGLRRCTFDTVTLDTYVGEVSALDAIVLRPDLAPYDCRNNRLAQLALEQDGFTAAVDSARRQYGSGRIAVVVGTSTSGIHQTELAFRRRSSETGALPPDFCYRTTHSTFSVAEFVARYLKLD